MSEINKNKTFTKKVKDITENREKSIVYERNEQGITRREKQAKLLNSIRVVTHNVQGLNEAIKYRNWIERCHEENVHIIAMSETKIAESSNHKFHLANP